MEKRTKQIVAIVAIVVIGVGTGVTVWFLLRSPWELPGAPDGIPEERWIKVGVLGDMNDIQGMGAYEGVYLKAKEINEGGGIEVNNITYYIAIAREDTGEARPVLDPSLGIAAVERLLSIGAEYFIGGFRTEAVEVYREPVMDAEKIFLGTGSADNDMCGALDEDYDKYKFWFRVMPNNGTALATQLFWFILVLQGILNATYYPTENIDTAVILREDLDWTEPFNDTSDFHNNLALYTGMTVVDYPYSDAATAEDFDDIWADIKDPGLSSTGRADLVIPIISAGTGIFMSAKWKASAAPCVVGGINVESQESSYWEETAGAAEFEFTMIPFTATNKTPVTLGFLDKYLDFYGHLPLYTAVGSYDALFLLADAINQTQSFDTDDLIPYLENGVWVGTSPSTNMFRFTGTHDVDSWMFPGDNRMLAQTLIAQWMDDGEGGGEFIAVDPFPYPDGQVHAAMNPYTFYPEGMVVNPFTVPDWVHAAWIV